MSVTLKIHFVDLVGYYRETQQGPFWALMPNTDNHCPMLVYRAASNDQDGQPLPGGFLHFLLLFDHHVHVQGDSQDGLDFPGTLPNGSFPNRADDHFNWVTPFDSSIHRGLNGFHFDQRVLTDPTIAKQKLYSRLKLRGGELRTERFVGQNGQMLSFRFLKAPGSTPSRAMVSAVRFKRELSGNIAKFLFEDLAGNSPSELELRPDSGDDINCAYVNLATSDSGTHFANFADLLTNGHNTPLPPSGELEPRISGTPRMVQNTTGIISDLHAALMLDPSFDPCARKRVIVNPEACPQARYD